MKRRDFLRLQRPQFRGPAVLRPSGQLSSGLEPYTGPWALPQAAHLLRRTMFGAKQEDVQEALARTLDEAVDELLSTDPIPAPPVVDYNGPDVTDPYSAAGETWVDDPIDNQYDGYRIQSLKGWWVRQILEQPRTIEQKMILFWHNHVPIQFIEVFVGRWDYRYWETLRENALGNIRSLIRALTLDPAMLHYLNGQYNSVGAPDENYARELQELFCIGKGPNAAFTEEDVRAAARILTGWRVNYSNLDEAVFTRAFHVTEDKQFSEFYHGTLISGRAGLAGAEELDDLLEMIFDNNETALFLARRLYRFFVSDLIDATVEANVIEPLAELLRDNDYEVLPALSTLFRSQHFFDALTLGVMIKSPTDFVLGIFRELRMTLPDPSDLASRYQIAGTLNYVNMVLQQDLGDPPNVAGWPAYYQLPQYDKNWINTDTLPRRGEVLAWFLYAGISTQGNAYNSIIDVVGIVDRFQNPEDPNDLIAAAADWLFGLPPSPAFSASLKSILLSGQSDDTYWTVAWLEYKSSGSPMDYQTVYSRLQSFFYFLLNAEEHQLA